MIRHGAWAGPAEEAVESLLSFEFGNTSPNRRWSLTPAVYDCLQEPQRLQLSVGTYRKSGHGLCLDTQKWFELVYAPIGGWGL